MLIILRKSIFFLTAVFAFNANANAENITKLSWPNQKETLEYHTCGCADGCWVAELRKIDTRELKAKLSCDCEKLYLAKGTHHAQLYADSCSAFEIDEKFKEITKEMHKINRRQPK